MALLLVARPGASPAAPAEETPPTPIAPSEPSPPALDVARAHHLLRLLGYVSFPPAAGPAPSQPLVIAVAGADEVYQALGPLVAHRLSHPRPIVRRIVHEGDGLTGVHLLYLGRRIDLQQSSLPRTARSLPVLLVTEHPDGLAAGAVFNLLTIQDPLRFEASLLAAERCGLTVSSRVLALAERVVGGR